MKNFKIPNIMYACMPICHIDHSQGVSITTEACNSVELPFGGPQEEDVGTTTCLELWGDGTSFPT